MEVKVLKRNDLMEEQTGVVPRDDVIESDTCWEVGKEKNNWDVEYKKQN